MGIGVSAIATPCRGHRKGLQLKQVVDAIQKTLLEAIRHPWYPAGRTKSCEIEEQERDNNVLIAWLKTSALEPLSPAANDQASATTTGHDKERRPIAKTSFI